MLRMEKVLADWSSDMNEKLKQLWDKAEQTRRPQKVGNIVVCDVCNEDFTTREDQGGFIFCSSAYCPECAAKQLPVIEGYNEQHLIRARCPEGTSFADFVRSYRGPDAVISVESF